MYITFDTVLPKTVPSTFSWDNGLPNESSGLIDLEIDSDGNYIGYAPFVLMRLSSVPLIDDAEVTQSYTWKDLSACSGGQGVLNTWAERKCDQQGGKQWKDIGSTASGSGCADIDPKDSQIYTIFRKIDFNDYYNCSQNTLTSIGFDENFYCHVYVMPGTYQPLLTFTSYITAEGTEATETILYQQESLDAEQSPALEFISRGDIVWKWERLTCNAIPTSSNEGCIVTSNSTNVINTITWSDTKCVSAFNQTWKQSLDRCLEFTPVISPLPLSRRTASKKIKIVEITPTAYLSAIQPSDPTTRISPLSVTLTSRFTKCGSFPIEKITWDLGDGSPILTQRRWSINNSYPFVYTGAISNDANDPRNYDVKHVYTVTKDSDFTFYPSMTAHAYSTDTKDCASTVVGPIKPQEYDMSTHNISLLQTNVSDQKVFTALVQIGDDVAVTKFEN
jgi:hypothetical protein